ncbi:hypothetical protein AB0D08_37945 [Kitasatospora sp. NPDC048540]|uniref:hypothetical protein n=1 Tax=Kitasatospora sp. NPDC048540 TaxID=3155634 RepID=UPI0033FED92F
MLRESGTATRPVRRHGRPKPLGGRFRLPTLRFSGAAMAMSTVVGISLLTTWLLNEQQQVGRQPRMSVGASPPVPSPDAATPAPARAAAAPGTPGPAPAPATTTAATALPGARQGAGSTAQPVTVRPTGTPSTPAGPDTADPGTGPEIALADASPSASPDSARPGGGSAQPSPGPTGLAPDHALRGTAEVTPLGRSGTRHTVALTVAEPLTALQVELRLSRPDVLPGTVPWSDLPGAVATVALDHDSLVYRFTLPPGVDVAPGRYSFTVTGAALPAAVLPGPVLPSPVPSGAARSADPRTMTVLPPTDRPTATVPPTAGPAAESWSASAFALRQPRAVAARGTFDSY